MNALTIITLCTLILIVSAIPKGESCTHAPTMCDPPLSCVGKPHNLRCFLKRGPGKKCGKDPFWVCQDGLECVGGFCKSTAMKGERCGRKIKCPPPLSCVGNKRNLRCFEKRKLGMNCGKDPFWVCEDGLTCYDGVCRTGAVKGERCGAGIACVEPLSCVGNPDNLRCFEKKKLGMTCGKDPFWVCDMGLVCDAHICKKAAKLGGRCGTPKRACKAGLSCVGGVCVHH